VHLHLATSCPPLQHSPSTIAICPPPLQQVLRAVATLSPQPIHHCNTSHVRPPASCNIPSVIATYFSRPIIAICPPPLQQALHHCNRSSASLQPFHPSPSTIATLLTCVHLHLATSRPSLQHISHAQSVRRCNATHPATASLRFSCNAPHAPTCTIHSGVLSRLSSKYIKPTPSNARLRSRALESGNGNSAASGDQATRGVHEDSRCENTLEDQTIQRRIALRKSHRFVQILVCREIGHC